MKMIKRLTTVVMILALLAVPMASFAEGVRSFTIGNIAFSGMGVDMKIGASIDVKYGSKDGRDIITLSVLGGETGTDEVGKVYFASDKDGIKATLDGLSEAFTISREELNQLMEQFANQAGGETAPQPDSKALMALIDSYTKLVASQKDKEAVKKSQIEANEKLVAYLGDRYQELGEESYEVFGETYTGQRVKFTYTMDDVDMIINMMGESDENAKAFLDSYLTFLSSLLASQGIEYKGSISQLYKDLGMTFSFDVDGISNDPNGKIGLGAAKVDYVFHLTADGQTVDLPMQIQSLVNEESQRASMLIDTVIEDIPLYLDMDVSETVDGKNNLTYVLSAGPEGEKIDVNMDIAQATSEDKSNMKLTMNVSLNGQQVMAGDVAYDATISKTGLGKAHEGKLTFNADVPEYGKVSFATDIRYANEPKAEVDFSAIDALPTVAFSEIDEEKTQALTSEAEIIGFKALGVLMQTPGVAEILSAAIAASQAGMSGTSEYGYEDYSADGEDFEEFEGFEDWQEIEGLDEDVPA